MIANARMYAVTPAVEAGWRDLLANVARDAGVPFVYETYPAPQPMEALWARPDLACVLMCGYPIAMAIAAVTPVAAPIPAAPWSGGRPVYRTDLVVRADSAFRSLPDTFGGSIGWTVENSHSGFNALRHHLLPYRQQQGQALYRRSVGPLTTPRNVLEAVLDGTIDVGPLDAYWHLLIRHAEPGLLADIRVLESTDTAPMPAFVAVGNADPAAVAAIRGALVAAASRPWFAGLADILCLDGFVAVDRADFAQTLAWDAQALNAGYLRPA